jgi:hypothetical protein
MSGDGVPGGPWNTKSGTSASLPAWFGQSSQEDDSPKMEDPDVADMDARLSHPCPQGSSNYLRSQRQRPPASTAPAIGATQNTHSCCIAQPPTSNAGPVLRAGFTDVLVTGMLMR